jgi:hypothetical protein
MELVKMLKYSLVTPDKAEAALEFMSLDEYLQKSMLM